jgi:hypothetical protein|tara:strand:+ start:5782 stop:5967 length:186 start_codon:yes stop_codon:yes gene_type:complete
MSVSSIKQDAQTIIDAYKNYSRLALDSKSDKKKSEKLRKYILNISNNISKKIEEVKSDVSD